MTLSSEGRLIKGRGVLAKVTITMVALKVTETMVAIVITMATVTVLITGSVLNLKGVADIEQISEGKVILNCLTWLGEGVAWDETGLAMSWPFTLLSGTPGGGL